ncbi:MAG TPA: hypothetical protein VG123_39510 [Streptosporangiaceae bacterium]|jgi:hypothetical protein|nr:hypothetical protein [Streptosporangiaceae bacterium]
MADDREPVPPAAGPGGAPSEPPGAGAAPATGPGQLLTDLAALRRRARAARHAYWFPLVLFGLLTCGAVPLYLVTASPPAGAAIYPLSTSPVVLGGLPFTSNGNGFFLGWYWAVALVVGYLLTLLWYRRHARRAGIQTPARGYLITGVILTVVALALQPLTRLLPQLSLFWLPFGDIWIRGTFAFLIIAAGLWVLARAEHSPGLTVIAAIYTGAALLASLYNVENILFRIGWNPATPFAWRLTALPNVLLPAAVLLVAGLVAFLGQRRTRPA